MPLHPIAIKCSICKVSSLSRRISQAPREPQFTTRIHCIPENQDYSPAKIGSFRINKQLPNYLFLSAENQKAWAHIMPCDAYSFLRDCKKMFINLNAKT